MTVSRRAAPNRLVDLIGGPLGFNPGVRYATSVPVRKVTSNDFRDTLQPGLLSPPVYMTFATILPAAPFYAAAGGISSLDYRYADRVTSIVGGPATHFVWRIEAFAGRIAPTYWRVWILPLPTP